MLPAALLGVIAVIAGSVAAHSDLAFIAYGAVLVVRIALVQFMLVRRGQLTVPWLGTAVAGVLAGLVSWTRLLAGVRTVSWEPTRR